MFNPIFREILVAYAVSFKFLGKYVILKIMFLEKHIILKGFKLKSLHLNEFLF